MFVFDIWNFLTFACKPRTHLHMKRYILLSLLLILISGVSKATGPVPFFRNFTPSEYDARSQNWSLAQDSCGFIYAGNNSCLLRFNGKSWDKLYPFGEKEAIIRSVYADMTDRRVFVGGFKEFGYFEYDHCGKMEYTSLYDRFPQEPDNNDEIWYITRIGKHIFFIYFTFYYIFDLETEELHKNEGSTSHFYFQDDCLCLLSDSGMARIFNGRETVPKTVPSPHVPAKLMKIFDGKLAVTQNGGIYDISSGKPERIDSTGNSWGVANRAIQCADGTIIVGFISSGVSAFTPDGKLLWQISAGKGLIDNTVLALLEDNCGNIWCALDKGLAVIYKDGDSLLDLTGHGIGKTTVALLLDDNLYVGSNQGLARFKIDETSLNLQKVDDNFRDQQIWSLYETDDQVIVGENSSVYVFDGNRLEKLSDAPGGITPRPFMLKNGQQVLIQGSFTQLYVYEKKNGKWLFSHTVDGFIRPVKNLETDYLGNIWIEHMYRGIYRIVLSDDGKTIKNETYYPMLGTKLCKMSGRVLFHDKYGFQYYDDLESKMKPYDTFNEALGEYRDCDRVIPAGGGRYWLARKKDALLINCRNDGTSILDRVNFNDFNANLTERFESALPLSGERFLFGLQDGFLIHDLNKSKAIRKHCQSFQITGIRSFQNDSLHSLSICPEKIIVPNNASLEINLAINGDKYYNSDILYELSPYDYEPRQMGNNMSVSYQRLHSGSYILKAWTDDWLGEPIATISIPFIVKPSIFASAPAILVYIASAVALLYLAWFCIQRAMKRQRMRLESEKEKEIISMRNEQLEESVFLKSKELATYSLIEARRNQVLQKLKETLSKTGFGKSGGMSKSDYDSLMSIIREGEFTEDNWERFYNNFDLIHKSFFRILIDKHPELTSNDLRVCAYLRLNMSTKELADVMGVTIKGAEAAKYRLRKKLNVHTSVPLNEYLSQIGKQDTSYCK